MLKKDIFRMFSAELIFLPVENILKKKFLTCFSAELIFNLKKIVLNYE